MTDPSNLITVEDPRMKVGRKLMAEGRTEEAVTLFGELLEVSVNLAGDQMATSLAPLYYEYGNALLAGAEESGSIFGSAVDKAEQEKAEALARAALLGNLEGRGSAASDEPAEASGGPGEDAAAEAAADTAAAKQGEEQAAAGDTEEDLEVAWETLDVARTLFNKWPETDDTKTRLSKVYLRLADVSMLNGMFQQATEDFTKCLQLRESLAKPPARAVVELHVRLGQSLLYSASISGLSEVEKEKLTASSTDHYQTAVSKLEVLVADLQAQLEAAGGAGAGSKKQQGEGGAKPKEEEEEAAADAMEEDHDEQENADANSGAAADAAPTKGKGKGKVAPKAEAGGGEGGEGGGGGEGEDVAAELEELKDVLEDLRETVVTMKSGQDLKAIAEYRSEAGTTTVGFGAPSAGAGAGPGADAGATTTERFGATATNGFGAATTTEGFGGEAGGGGAAPVANLMVAKRKAKPAAAATAASVATAAAGKGTSSAAAAEGEAVEGTGKKAKGGE